MAPGHSETTFPADFEALFRQAPAGYLVTGIEGTILEVNDAFLAWASLDRAAVLGMDLMTFLPVEDRIRYATQAVPQLATTGACGDLALDIMGSNGMRHPAILAATRSNPTPGEPSVDRIIMLGTAQRRSHGNQPKTAPHRAEEADNARISAQADAAAHRNALAESENELRLALRQSRRNESLLKTILNTVDIGIAVVDPEASPIMNNSRYRHDLEHATSKGSDGETESGLLAFGPDRSTLVPEDIPLLRAARGESFSDDLIWIGPPGDQRALSVSARPVSEPDDFTGSVIAYSDVTQLINAVAAKDDFLANVSHELRTPLTSIIGHLDLVLDEPGLPGHITAALNVALRNSERLLQLVGDLLSTATAGNAMAPQPVDLAGLIHDSIRSAAPRAQSNNVTITTDIPPTLPAVLDPRISQVLDNLLSNAIKFSPEGGRITIAARHTTEHLLLQVTDTGIGMTPEELQVAFSKFFRSCTAMKAAIPGAGLGLAIARNIVEAHHGTIALTSEPGRGTSATITLPKPAGQDCSLPAPGPAPAPR